MQKLNSAHSDQADQDQKVKAMEALIAQLMARVGELEKNNSDQSNMSPRHNNGPGPAHAHQNASISSFSVP